MDKIGDIRRRGRRGQTVASISRETGVSEPTVRRYLRMGDLSPERPRRSAPGSELLAPHVADIDAWLDSDLRNWRKQRHTATKACARLREGRGYQGPCSTARRYVRLRRQEMAEERDRRDAQGFPGLSWLPGECQVDFGEADLGVRGVTVRGKYLTAAFPHPDVGLAQVFWGETPGCVCQGLGNVFEFVGGVPRRAVFDDATEVGRRIGSEARVSEPFRRFAAHYGLDHALANPHSGNERGNVEDEVGTHRGNLFVPVPTLGDVEAFDGRLLESRVAPGEGKVRHRLGRPESELLGEDRDALSPLPAAALSCVRWEARKRGRQGTLAVGGARRRSAGPAHACREVAVALGAFLVTVRDCETGEVVATYEREWGEAPTDSSDPLPRPRLLCMRPNGWRDSSVRLSLPDELVSFPGGEPASGPRADPGVLRDESSERGWGAAAGGHARVGAGDRPRRPRIRGRVGRAGPVGGCAHGIRRGGRPRRLRQRAGAPGGRRGGCP